MPDIVIDTKQERYAACAGYIRRSRWLSVIAAALAGVLILNIYLERFDLQELQLIDALSRRGAVDELIRELEEDVLVARQSNASEEYERLSQRLGRLKYLRVRTDNTIARAGLESRNLPVLGLPIAVAADEFSPVLCVGVAIFTLGLWLSLRFVEFTVLELRRASELEEVAHLIRLHFNFSMALNGGSGDKIATFVQYAVVTLPMFAVLASGFFEAFSVAVALSDRDLASVDYLRILLVRSMLLSSVLLLVVMVVAANLKRVRRLDRELGRHSFTRIDPEDTLIPLLEEPKVEKANRDHNAEGNSTDSPKDTEPQAEADS